MSHHVSPTIEMPVFWHRPSQNSQPTGALDETGRESHEFSMGSNPIVLNGHITTYTSSMWYFFPPLFQKASILVALVKNSFYAKKTAGVKMSLHVVG